MRQSLFLCSMLAVLTTAPAFAEADLSCVITGVSEITADGRMEALEGKKNYYETAVGAEFIVQRDKGIMAGRFVGNTGSKITVLDMGSAQQSYKVLSVRSSGRVQSQFLEVRLQEKNEKKPFFLLAAEILYGYCTL
jgi:hypothetical protein